MAKTRNTRSRTSSRKRDRVSDAVKSAATWANSSTGRSILAGVAATAAGLLLSRDRRVREAAGEAGEKIREAAGEARQRVREEINKRRGTEVGDDLAPDFDVPQTGRTDTSASVIAH